MNKGSILAINVVLFTLLTQQAFALDIKVQSDGTITIYSNTVLGESTDKTAGSSAQPSKVIPPFNQQEVRVKTNEGHLRVETLKRDAKVTNPPKPEMSAETSKVLLEYPVQPTAAQEKLRKQEKESATPKPNEEYLQKLESQREERKQEALEIRSRYDDQNRPELELRSKAAAARLKGAEFSYDQATNQIKVVTLSGEEHTLHHLPDQALERIKTAIQTNDLEFIQENLEVSTTADGKVIYKLKASGTKKLFGFFPRKIEKQVILEDNTGKVRTEEMIPESIMGRILHSLSF